MMDQLCLKVFDFKVDFRLINLGQMNKRETKIEYWMANFMFYVIRKI